MVKRAFIIHGWDGYPEEGWFPWLKRELEKAEFQVFVPAMPEPEHPRIETWVPYLAKLVGKPDTETYLVGHSIGCQTIIRYLEQLPENIRIGGAVFVAGWFDLFDSSYEKEEEKEIAQPWIKTPIDFEKVNRHTNNFLAIFSEDDPCVPLSDSKKFKEKLNAEIIIAHNKGHFNGGDKITKIPAVLKKLLQMAKS